MLDGLLLVDRAYFGSREWLDQKNLLGGFGRGTAWLDLLGLTNQGQADLGNGRIILRGQCGWSILALSIRWGWSQGKVRATLQSWQKKDRIEVEILANNGTLITVKNFDSYQTPIERPSRGHREETERGLRGHREAIETEKGEGRREKEPPPQEVSIPSEEDVKTWASMSAVPEDYAVAQYLKIDADRAWRARDGGMIDWRKKIRGRLIEDRIAGRVKGAVSEKKRLPGDSELWWTCSREEFDGTLVGARGDAAMTARLAEIEKERWG